MPRSLLDKAVDDKVRLVKLETPLLRRMKDVTLSLPQLATVTWAMLDSQDLVALVTTIKKNTESAMSIESKRGERRPNLVVAVYNTGIRSAL